MWGIGVGFILVWGLFFELDDAGFEGGELAFEFAYAAGEGCGFWGVVHGVSFGKWVNDSD